ncbi:hypothetical protein CLAIMM_02409 [Cladophialophora immunda]|nr:hypothetical protein CLAIMM_02409 [Cladophialophora immunda]
MEKAGIDNVLETTVSYDETSHVEDGHQEKAELDLIARSAIRQQRSSIENRVVRKCDFTILPLGALAFFASYLDRNCIGNAQVMGMGKDLGLTASQFYDTVTLLFVGYIIMLMPANILNRKLKPNRSIGAGVVFFGVMLCGMSAAQNYATLVVLRLLIGCGSSFVPIITIYTSLYYTRSELATRVAILYAASTTSGAFGGLIAYAIQRDLSQEATGRAPWRWLFLIEGIAAIFVGLLVITLLPRYADDLQKRGKRHWLFTEEEIASAAERSAAYNTEGAKVQPAQLWRTLRDPKTYLFAVCQSASVLGVGVVGSFLPIFIHDFGFSALRTQLFTIIPYVCASIMVLVTGIWSDRIGRKGPFLLSGYIACIVGYIMLLSTTNAVASVVAACFITAGCYSAIIILPVWIAINTGGFTKRGATWAFAECCGLCFSVMGTRIYTTPPRFVKGHSIVLGFNAVALCSALVCIWWMRRENRKKDLIVQEYAGRNELHPHIASHATLEEVSDQHISFRYIW